MIYLDLITSPGLFLIMFTYIRNMSNQLYPNKPLERKYFVSAFVLKCFGAIALGLIYQFYYYGGDTFNYYENAMHLSRALTTEPSVGLQLLFGEAGVYTPENLKYARYMYFYSDAASYFVVRVAGFIGLITFNTYSGIALTFALISFSGIWSIYSVLIKEYPYLKKQLAYGCLFLPSIVFWGSGLMKDSLCLAGLGWLFYGVYHLAILRKKIVRSSILIVLGGYLLASIKLYILLSILPAMMVWLAIYYNKQLSMAIRIVAFPIILVLLSGIGYLIVVNLSQESEKYSLEKLQETSRVTSHYLKRISDEGASYSLSAPFDGSIGSTIRLAPEAVIASFFRPAIFESRNIVMLMSGAENTIILVLFLLGLFRLALDKKVRVQNHSLITFCIVFSTLFAIGIGLTTFNFGALARYKLPLLPFLTATVIVWNFKNSSLRKLIWKKKKMMAQKASS